MNFLNKLFGKKEDVQITSYQDFWNWFQQNEHIFFKSIMAQNDMATNCINPIMDKLQILNEQFYCQVGKASEHKADLVITPEGDIKNFVFTEELINTAPILPNWIFTHLKQPVFSGVSIKMGGYVFNKETVGFYYEMDKNYPDEINITLLHKNYDDDDKNTIVTGCRVLIETVLGEFNSNTLIDSLTVEESNTCDKEIVSIEKLNDFLVWREKEFVEKYQLVLKDENEYDFTQYKFETEEGLVTIAMINSTFLNLEERPSFPWMLYIEIEYEMDNDSGMPNDEILNLLNNFTVELEELLKVSNGYLSLGRETGNSKRIIYFACKEFKKSSKTTHELIQKYANRLSISYDIYKDKYWMTMDRYGV
jgi:Family of unknown function (DUF695)